jgi:cyanate permease
MAIGPPLGSGLFAALAGQALVVAGWREAFAFFALFPLLVLCPLIWRAVPPRFDDPSPVAEDGGVAEAAGDLDEAVRPAAAVRGDNRSAGGPSKSVLARPVFWWTAGVFALAAGVPTGWTVHVAAYLGGVGLSTAEQSTVLAAQFWMGVPGALVFGMLADRVSITGLFVVMLSAVSLSMLGYAWLPSPLVVTLLAIALGFATGGMIPLYMMLLGKRVGPEAMGRAMGLSNVFMLPVMAVAVLLAASIFEAQGSYASALIVFAIAVAAAIGCVFGSSWSARRP